MIISFIFLCLVFEINSPLQGRAARLYLQSQMNKQQELQTFTRAASSFQGERVWKMKVRLALFQELDAVNLQDFFPALPTRK